MEDQKLWYLSQIHLFSDLDRDTLIKLDQVAPMTTVRRGHVVAQPGETDSVLYLLKQDRVRLYKTTPNGREITLAILGDGNVFGATASLGLGSSDMYAEALQDSVLCVLREEDLAALIQGNPAVGLRLISLLSRRVRELESLVESLSLQDVQGRIVRLLLHLADSFGVSDGAFTRLDVPLTHEEIATMVGSTRETVTATLSQLGRLGFVRTGRREIAIRRELLAQWLDTRNR